MQSFRRRVGQATKACPRQISSLRRRQCNLKWAQGRIFGRGLGGGGITFPSEELTLKLQERQWTGPVKGRNQECHGTEGISVVAQFTCATLAMVLSCNPRAILQTRIVDEIKTTAPHLPLNKALHRDSWWRNVHDRTVRRTKCFSGRDGKTILRCKKAMASHGARGPAEEWRNLSAAAVV